MEARGGGREAGGGGCSVGGSGGSSGGAAGASARPAAAAEVVVELRWRPDPDLEPGAGSGLLPGPGRRLQGRSGCGRVGV